MAARMFGAISLDRALTFLKRFSKTYHVENLDGWSVLVDGKGGRHFIIDTDSPGHGVPYQNLKFWNVHRQGLVDGLEASLPEDFA